MGKVCWFICLMICCFSGNAQSVEVRLAQAVEALEKDPQMRHGLLGLAVMDAKTGLMLYGRNEQIGLAPASTQKIITSASAFELLGNDFRYKTKLGYSGTIKNGTLDGSLYVIGSGDPTFGSWRYKTTRDSVVLREFIGKIKQAGIRKIDGYITTNESAFSHQSIPDGWIWQDIGNYYGAGAYQLNWRENQYDLQLRSGSKLNDSVHIVGRLNGYPDDSESEVSVVNELRTASKNSGDNAYIYLGTNGGRSMLVKGTIPVDEKSFTISGADDNPAEGLLLLLSMGLMADSIQSEVCCASPKDVLLRNKNELAKLKYFHTYLSPSLDSINYWFMRRSINLYGEALVKTIGYEKAGYGDTDSGLRIVKNFWADKGIDRHAINIIDGSGLSPQNRITTDALVRILQFARTRPWYASFYASLPTYNGMKLKSGSIGGARAYAGYHTSANGKEYIVAIIANNYSGSSGEIVKKMFKVLDVLK